MPARIKRTPGQEASLANHEWERFAGEMLRRLWDWHDDALAEGERETAAEIERIMGSAHCFIEEWGGITERIDAIAHVRPAVSPGAGEEPTEGEPVTDDSTPAVPAEPVSRPAKKKRKLVP